MRRRKFLKNTARGLLGCGGLAALDKLAQKALREATNMQRRLLRAAVFLRPVAAAGEAARSWTISSSETTSR